ncbi:hypothetical protein BsWGS_14611 [Bradybaena similaris]
MGVAISVLDAVSWLTNNEETAMIYLTYTMIVSGLMAAISLLQRPAPYGRYSSTGWGILLPSTAAWILQELPSLCIPLMLALFTDCPKLGHTSNRLALGLFLLHYFQRALVFPFLIRGGKPTPLSVFLMAFTFCTVNGYLQGGYILKYAGLTWTPQMYPRVIAGASLFLSGMIINLHSDSILRNLRKPGESGYKIPYGGMFTYVSGPNFFGEILEWWGFAVLNWSLPALAFALFTLFNIGPRALHHHRWYKEKFDDYPKNRKALIPFLL